MCRSKRLWDERTPSDYNLSYQEVQTAEMVKLKALNDHPSERPMTVNDDFRGKSVNLSDDLITGPHLIGDLGGARRGHLVTERT